MGDMDHRHQPTNQSDTFAHPNMDVHQPKPQTNIRSTIENDKSNLFLKFFFILFPLTLHFTPITLSNS